jgi:peroxiredoxin
LTWVGDAWRRAVGHILTWVGGAWRCTWRDPGVTERDVLVTDATKLAALDQIGAVAPRCAFGTIAAKCHDVGVRTLKIAGRLTLCIEGKSCLDDSPDRVYTEIGGLFGKAAVFGGIMMWRLAATVGVMLVMVQACLAEPLKIGDAAPNFEKLTSADGKTYSLSDFKRNDVLVVCVFCNHCPVAIKYQDRLIEFAKRYSTRSQVGLVAINVNDDPRDSLQKMTELAKEKGFSFPYLYDPSQQIVVQLGATVTPEFFVFNRERKLVYHGTFDDNMKLEKVTKQYVIPAVDATLDGGKIETPKTAPFGCGIIFKKKK